MGISYDPTKPAAGDRPSNDQSPMQQNFSSIKTLIDVDHVDFSNAQYGQHNQVTFATINPPNPPSTFPITPPQLFTNTQDGAGNALPGNLAQLFFYSGSATASKNQYNVTSTNGSVLLPMGIILKWGSYTLAPGVVSTSINFTEAFPNNIFSIVTGSNVSGSPNDLPRIISNSQSGFVGGRVNSTSPLGGTYTYYFVAIGN